MKYIINESLFLDKLFLVHLCVKGYWHFNDFCQVSHAENAERQRLTLTD